MDSRSGSGVRIARGKCFRQRCLTGIAFPVLLSAVVANGSCDEAPPVRIVSPAASFPALAPRGLETNDGGRPRPRGRSDSADGGHLSPADAVPSGHDGAGHVGADHDGNGDAPAGHQRDGRVPAGGFSAGRQGLSGPAVTMASSLAVVLGLFGGLVWMIRRYGRSQLLRGELPTAAVERLGMHTIDARTRLHLIRCGERVLVVAQNPAGLQAISEIGDPDEAARLVARCRGDREADFAGTLRSIGRERAASGFVTPSVPESSGSHPRPSGTAAAQPAKPRPSLFATG